MGKKQSKRNKGFKTPKANEPSKPQGFGLWQTTKKAVTSTYSKVIAVLLLCVFLSIGFYEYGRSTGIDEMVDETTQSYTFSVGDDAYTESDVTEVLMQSDSEGSYHDRVISKVMAEELKENDADFEVTQVQIDDYAKSEALVFETLGLNADTFAMHIDSNYGGAENYQEAVRHTLYKAEYAREFADTEQITKDLRDVLVGEPTYTLDVSVDGADPVEQELTPYEIYMAFGGGELARLYNADIGADVETERDELPITFTVKDRSGEYTLEALEADIEGDVDFYLDAEVQKRMVDRAEGYIESNPEVLKFHSTFDASTYTRGGLVDETKQEGE